MKTGIITTNTYLNHDTGQGHPERADRVTVVIDHLKKMKSKNLIWKKPIKFDLKYLALAHDKNYLDNVKDSFPKQGLNFLDGDTIISPGSKEATQDAVGSILTAIDGVIKKDFDSIEKIAERVSKLEHEADIIKNEIRDQLPRTLFMPVSRSDFFTVLATMDSIPDSVEDLCVLFSLRRMLLPSELEQDLLHFLKESLTVFYRTNDVIEQVEDLVGSAFGGFDTQTLYEKINEINQLEWAADKSQFVLVKHMHDIEEQMDPVSIYQWSKIFQTIGDLANFSEKTADRLRTLFSK